MALDPQQNLDRLQQIVDANGRPSNYFIQLIQRNGSVVNVLKSIEITSDDGTITVTNGKLNSGLDPDLSVNTQEVLDAIGDTQGSILYRS